jgi:hypothetical protein
VEGTLSNYDYSDAYAVEANVPHMGKRIG